MNLEQQAMEYIDCLVSAELACAMARKFGGKENQSIKNCCNALLRRIRDRQNYLIFECLRNQPSRLAHWR